MVSKVNVYSPRTKKYKLCKDTRDMAYAPVTYAQ